jgi:pimeloyl-ACP methyl ester carboxylesterase
MWLRYVAPWFRARGRIVAAPRIAPRGSVSGRLRDYVAAARTASDALGGRPVVIGHSLGGLVAQHLAAERRLAGLVLVGSPGPMGVGPSLWRLSAQRPRVLAALTLAQMGAGPLLGPAAARRALFTDAAPDAWVREHAPVPIPESPLALLDAMTWDLPFWPAALGTPTLGLLGSEDAFIPRSDLSAIALCYGAETEVLPDMAHGAPLDPHWKRLAWRIDAWMDALAPVG